MASDMKEIYNAIPVSNLVRESSLEKVMLELRCEDSLGEEISVRKSCV